jgi:uncharacterized protein
MDGAALPRFSRLCEATETISVKLQFNRDDQGRIVVDGHLRGDIELGCHRCEESVQRRIEVEFSAAVAFTEEQAASWTGADADIDIVVVTGQHLDVVELVEDELLLALPDRVCADDNCSNMPAMHYADSDCSERQDDSAEESRRLPFAGLKEAMRDLDKEMPS